MPAIKKYDSVWFPYPADPENVDITKDYKPDPLGGEVEIRYLNEGERQELRAKSLPLRTDYAAGEQKISAKIDQIKDRQETAKAFVKNWRNFFDGKKFKGSPNGNPLACNDENKKLYSFEDGFMNFVMQAKDVVAKQVEEIKKAELKN